jgi:hypothetical protein
LHAYPALHDAALQHTPSTHDRLSHSPATEHDWPSVRNEKISPVVE